MLVSRRNVLYGIGAGALSLGTRSSPAYPYFSAAPQAGKPIRLDRNENPYGPSEPVIAAMRGNLEESNRYPDSSKALREKIASHHNVKAEQVVLGCGSSEILRMAADAFLRPGKKLILAKPSYPLLSFYAQAKGVDMLEVPLTSDRSHDLKAMLAASDGATGLVYICNPNNPTGTLTGRQELEEFLRKLPSGIPTIIDEAYHDYVAPTSSYASFIDRPVGDGRTIVTRTFSKIYGLAGLRIGYAVAPLQLATRLAAFHLQFAENTIGLKAAMAALDDQEHVRLSALRNAGQRQEFYNHANVRMADVVNSQTNFVLLQLDHPIDEVVTHFRNHNVLVGQFPGVDDHLRVSIGRPEETKEFWRVWDMLPHKDMHM